MLKLTRTYRHIDAKELAALDADIHTNRTEALVLTYMDGNLEVLAGLVIIWRSVSWADRPVPELCAFDNSWRGLAAFSQDLLDGLADLDSKLATVDQVTAMLRSIGFTEIQ